MALSTSEPRATDVTRSEADHWGITQFIVTTPQDGSANRLEVRSESWVGPVGTGRTAVTPIKLTELIGDLAIAPILDRAGELYEEARAAGAPRSTAQYVALKNALQELQQATGAFPQDAT